MSMSFSYKAVVIGSSAGGLLALSSILSGIPAGYPFPIIGVQHRSRDDKELLEEVLRHKCDGMRIKQADEKEKIEQGWVYMAPPDYHLLIERDRTFSLSSDMPVKYSRPSIDVLFESAAEVYGRELLGIVLTGANDDGAAGVRSIRKHGGFTIAQNPEEAEYKAMPLAALKTGAVNLVLSLKEIQLFLIRKGK